MSMTLQINFDDEQQQAGPSKKKSRLEEIIENYDSSEDQSIVFDGNEDGQLERNNVIKRGREKKNVGEDVIEIDEGADLEAFAKNDRKHKIKEYTHYLKDYAEFDVFEPILEDGNSKDFKVKNVFRRKNLTHCILKSIMGAIYQKQYEKGGESYVDFVDGV